MNRIRPELSECVNHIVFFPQTNVIVVLLYNKLRIAGRHTFAGHFNRNTWICALSCKWSISQLCGKQIQVKRFYLFVCLCLSWALTKTLDLCLCDFMHYSAATWLDNCINVQAFLLKWPVSVCHFWQILLNTLFPKLIQKWHVNYTGILSGERWCHDHSTTTDIALLHDISFRFNLILNSR